VLARCQICTQLIEIESRPQSVISPSSPIGSLPSDNNVLFLSPTPSLSLLQFQWQNVRCNEVGRDRNCREVSPGLVDSLLRGCSGSAAQMRNKEKKKKKKKKKGGNKGEVTELFFSFICLLFASQP